MTILGIISGQNMCLGHLCWNGERCTGNNRPYAEGTYCGPKMVSGNIQQIMFKDTFPVQHTCF